MNRQELINRIVAQKLHTNAAGKTFCMPQRVFCICIGGPAKANTVGMKN